MKSRIALLALFLVSSATAAEVKLAATPALSPDGKTLVFEWQEDLWSVSSSGGVARALTRNKAVDRFPVFSPDGSQIAFMSGRDDWMQAYVMPASGGPPRQVTFNSGGATPQDWFPDGHRLLVRGTRDSGAFLPQRFMTVDTAQRVAEQNVFDATCDWGRISPDGSKLLFMRGGEDSYRRGYRGSKCATIWSFDFKSGAFTEICHASDGGDCRWPLWKPDGKGIYFLREGKERGCLNLFEKEFPDGREKQLTFFKDFGVMFPAISHDGSTVVFRNGFDFYRWQPGAKEPDRIAVFAADDEEATQMRRMTYARATAEDVEGSVNFSTDAKQIVFASGGSLWAMDTVVREPVPITRGQGMMDNWASFSPDDKAIFYIHDSGDRANIYKATRADPGEPWWRNTSFKVEPVTDDDHGRFKLQLAPRGGLMAWVEQPGSLWVAKLDGSEPHKILTSPFDMDFDWSPDGKWIVSAVQDSDDNRDVWIFSADGKHEPYNLSRHPNWDGFPKWSPDGRVIAYVGRTYDNETDIYYAWLREADNGKLVKETEWIKAEEEDQKEKKKAGTNAPPAEVKDVKIDFDGLCDRVQRVHLAGVTTTPENLFWSDDSKALAFQSTIEGKLGTWKIYFPHPEKPDFMTATHGTWPRWTQKAVTWSVDGVPSALETHYTFRVQFERDIIAWRQFGFRRMWRALRDEFYDPKLNNLDWNAVRARYEQLVSQVDEAGFARLVEMMQGELNASHLGYTPPKKKTAVDGEWPVHTGHLGVHFDSGFAGPGLRVSDVIPESPADRDITRIKPGDVILTIDDTAVSPGFDLTQLLNGPLPRFAELEIQRGESHLKIRLPLTAPEEILKLAHEAETKTATARVNDWSKGRAGYIDIAHMKTEDLRQFEKEVYAQGFGRDGLVIDVRNNTGGFVADQILGILCHPNHAVTIPRGGEASYQGSYVGHPYWMKPIVVLCNEYTVSNGEIFSHAIKTTKRGKLVGKPTQGGCISTADHQMLDLGTFRIPHRGWFPRSTGLDMEHHGCVPDIIVDDPPSARAKGEDPQLKAAVEALLTDIESHRRDLPAVHYATEEKN